jgi:hypothetical protein
MAAESAAHHAVEKEREIAKKEKEALVGMIFAEINGLLLKNSERINFSDGTCKGYFRGTLEEDLIELRKKYMKKYKGDQSNE